MTSPRLPNRLRPSVAPPTVAEASAGPTRPNDGDGAVRAAWVAAATAIIAAVISLGGTIYTSNISSVEKEKDEASVLYSQFIADQQILTQAEQATFITLTDSRSAAESSFVKENELDELIKKSHEQYLKFELSWTSLKTKAAPAVVEAADVSASSHKAIDELVDDGSVSLMFGPGVKDELKTKVEGIDAVNDRVITVVAADLRG